VCLWYLCLAEPISGLLSTPTLGVIQAVGDAVATEDRAIKVQGKQRAVHGGRVLAAVAHLHTQGNTRQGLSPPPLSLGLPYMGPRGEAQGGALTILSKTSALLGPLTLLSPSR
jgi:hypothetical protein